MRNLLNHFWQFNYVLLFDVYQTKLKRNLSASFFRTSEIIILTYLKNILVESDESVRKIKSVFYSYLQGTIQNECHITP